MSIELPSIRDICEPRDDVRKGVGDRFTANLNQVINNNGPDVYKDPALFFENTHPTEGLIETVYEVFSRLTKKGAGTSVIKLETSLGGGKTHTLIALYHLAKHGSSITQKSAILKGLEFSPINVAAVVGTDVQSTIWGDIARKLKGNVGYKIIKEQDEKRISPTESQLKQLFGSEKCLILLDEMALYLGKASAVRVEDSNLAEQTKVFFQVLTQVADAMDNVCLVITSLTKTDVFSQRTEELKDIFDNEMAKAKATQAIKETDGVLSRIGINLTPTKGEEFPAIMRKRLFKSINRTAALEVCNAYHTSLNKDGVKEYMPKYATEAKYVKFFQESYPFHPEFIQILRTKTSSISNFNQTRGVLRLLALVIKHIWDKKLDAPMIHPYHIDFSESDFTNELISRLDRGEYMAAITADIADSRGTPRASAIDEKFSEPLGTWICTTVFLHSQTGVVVSPDVRRGANEAEIQLALHHPGLDPKTVENALKEVEDKCFYLVKHGSMYAFSNEPGLNKIIEEAKSTVESTLVLRECEKRIETIFGGRKYFDPRIFANNPSMVPDDTGKPKLVIPHFNDCSTTGGTTKTPEMVENIFNHAGTQGKPRIYSNNILFLIADSEEMEKMEFKAREYLALKKLCDDIDEGTPSLQALSKTQRDKLKEKRQEAELFLKVAVILVYKHFFLPTIQKSLDEVQSKKPVRKISARMQDSKIGEWIKSNKSQEESILEFLKEHEAVRTADDSPWAPELVIQKFWSKNTESLTGDDFKKLFYRNPEARIIMSEDLILRAQQNGVKSGTWLAIREGQVYDKINAPVFTGAFSSDTQIILTDSDAGKIAHEQFYCDKCQKKKTECKCSTSKCPKCGKTLDSCTCKEAICPVCGKPIASCGGVHGPTIIPLIADKTIQGIIGELLPMLDDKGVEAIECIELKAKGRDDLSRLILAIPQFLGAKIHYNTTATLNEEHKGGNFIQVSYRGDDTGFKIVKPVLLNYVPKEQFSSCNLAIMFSWDSGILRDELLMILRDKVSHFTGDSIYTAIVTPKETKKK